MGGRRRIGGWPRFALGTVTLALVMGTVSWAPLHAMELRAHQVNSAARMVAEGNEALVLRQYERAIASYQQALELDSRDFNALYNLGLAWQIQERWEQARRRFEEALLQRPDHAATMCNLGIIAYRLGEYHEAASRFSSAAQLAANNSNEAADYLYNAGTAYEALGQWSEARDAYRAASELDPNHFNALYNLGSLSMGNHVRHLAGAERYLKLAQRVAPERSEPILNLAILFESLGRMDEAQQHFDLAVATAREQQPNHLPTTLWRRALFNKNRQPPQPVAMRRDLEELLRRDANYPGANGLLGIHYFNLWEIDQAIPLLEREVAEGNFNPQDDGDIEVIYRLARIYSQERPNTRLAMEYATRYYRLRPDSPQERDLRRRLRTMTSNQGATTTASEAP